MNISRLQRMWTFVTGCGKGKYYNEKRVDTIHLRESKP
jgi:hypothetical protein